ncbi:hypothetical protein N2152v2_000897 [Parachlorella kessleri]
MANYPFSDELMRQWDAIESRLDVAVASLKTLLLAFQREPNTAVDWAITSCVILLQYILQLPKKCPQKATCHQALLSVMGVANRLLEVAIARTGGIGTTVSLWGIFAKDAGCLILLAKFLLAEAAKQDANVCLVSLAVPRAWQLLGLLLLLPDADKAVHPCFVKALSEHHAARDSWTSFLQHLARVLRAACGGVYSVATVMFQPALRELSLALMSILNGCSRLQSRLLHELKGPHAADALSAQWAEQLSLDTAGQCLGIIEGVAGWEGEAWRDRGMLLRSCGGILPAFLTGSFEQREDIIQPAFSKFAAASHITQPSSRISGRQAVAAVTSAVALAEHALRLAGRIPLSYWTGAQGVAETCAAAAGPEYQPQPWTLCSNVAAVAGRWLMQRLPARPGGPAPVLLISLLEGGAVPGCFKSLLGLMATQRKLVRKWSAAFSSKLDAWEEHPPALQFLLVMERLVHDVTVAALGLAHRLPDKPQGSFTSHRHVESVAAVALGSALTVKHLLAPYEHWAWQQGSRAWPKSYCAQLPAHLLPALSQGSSNGSLHATLLATAPLLLGPGKAAQGAADVSEDQVFSWMAGFCKAVGLDLHDQPPGLLISAVQGGLLRSLAGWAQQACQRLTKGEAEATADLLKMLDFLFSRCCQELDEHVGWHGYCRCNTQLQDTYNLRQPAHMDSMTQRQLAGLRASLTAAWQTRSIKLLPHMEAAAAWGTRYLMVWSNGGNYGTSVQSSSARGDRTIGSSCDGRGGGAAQTSRSQDDGTVLPPGSPLCLTPTGDTEDVAVAAASLQTLMTGRRDSPGIASPTSQPGPAKCMAGGASSLSPTVVTPSGRELQPGSRKQQQQQQQQLDYQQP